MSSGSQPIHLSNLSSRSDFHTPVQDSTPAEACGKPHKPSVYDRYIQDSWWLEFVSWLLATVMLLALLILLGKFNGKSLSEWHSRLSLNTIIAAVSQLVQMVLLVPIASSLSQLRWLWYRNRKPLEDMSYIQDASISLMGGLILLYKGYASLVVWLGVICMILQVLFGAFAQQALSLPLRRISTSQEGIISRSLTYDTPAKGNEFYSMEVVPEMQLAIYNGLLRDGVNPSEVQGSSVTGNCTFGVFTSMGVCASVEDVTPSIVADCKNTESSSGISDGECSYAVSALRKIRLADDRSIVWGNVGLTLYMGSSMNSEDSADSALIEIYVIYAPDLTITNPYGKELNYSGNLAALKGTLSLCAHTYNSSMQFGVTNTTLLARETYLPWRYIPAANPDNSVIHTASVSGTNDTLSMHNLSMNSLSMLGLSMLLMSSVFDGTVTMYPPGPPPQTAFQGMFSTLASKQVAIHLYGNEMGTKVADGVGALSGLLDNVAMSMSNGLRTTSTNLTYQTGTSYTMEVYFQVSWLWLIVPILSIPVTLILLAITIHRSWRDNIPPWKSSRLATLQALNPSLRAKLGDGMSKNSELEGMVRRKAVYVRLNRVDGDRWELGEE